MIAYPLLFLTWRESVVGLKPTESVQMDLLHTWDMKAVSSSGTTGGRTDGGNGVQSETLGYVRWRIGDTMMLAKTYRLLHSQTYDKKSGTLTMEDVYTDEKGQIVRQYEERTTPQGKRISDAAFFDDRIELARTDLKGKTIFCEVHPSGGMEIVQERFKPMTGSKKEFLHLEGITGTFHKVQIERAGKFSGAWNGNRYEGASYRFTVDGKDLVLMMTPEDEVVQVDFQKGVQLVLAGPTASRRAPAFNAPVPRSQP